MALANNNSNGSNNTSNNNGPMSNAREATRLAQQLATDLQLAGMQCVEALVEWMLVAGAKAAYVSSVDSME
ncbi:hypothetical protein PINS_up004715 [Pythium insidiosum]|nr:hypothetical protein PINS_up004715 [Pythium insidiosum]